ncbi:MAG: SsrA-binding protein SmpB [Candidatus Saganbacteria bacterium]|nr:SsrA-binding protein SmpB [Candidatus Saganbacteria bacterium]
MARYFKQIADNRRARHDYNVIEVYKVGVVLTGTEVKSVRMGRVNLKDSFARAEKGALLVYGMHISPYGKGSIYNVDPMRPRKILLEKGELIKLIGKVSQKGLTLIPLKLYFDGNWAKIDLGLCKAKKLYEKREVLKEKDIKRETERELSEKFKEKRS